MGEYVWTSMTIGGQLSTDTADALREAASDYFTDADHDLDMAVGKGTSVTFQGECNYGNADEMEEFCRENGLAYVLTWAAASGAFDAGSHAWRPGMDHPIEVTATDNEDPAICLACLKQEIAAGKTLADVIAGLEPADAATIPPLQIVEV